MFLYFASLRANKIIYYTVTALIFGLWFAPIPVYFISIFPKIDMSYLSCVNWFPELSCTNFPSLQLLVYGGVLAFLILIILGLFMNIDSYMLVMKDKLPFIIIIPYIIFSATTFLYLQEKGFTTDRLGGDTAGYFTRSFVFVSAMIFLVDGIFMCRTLIRRLF